MIIQVWHSRDFDFQNELYIPIKNSNFFSDHTFIFPHDDVNIDSRESLKMADIFLIETTRAATWLGIEIGFASTYNKKIVCIHKKWCHVSTSLQKLSDACIEYANSDYMIQKIWEYIQSKYSKIEKQKIYIGCALTYASPEFRDSIALFKDWLRSQYDVLDFTGVLDGWTILSTEIYAHNRRCVLNSDLFIAECSYPSTGLGYEIATAIENNKKILLIAHQDALVTRMILWIPEDQAKMVRYNDLEDIFPIVSQMFPHG